ncbi:sensor histidine kinase [Ramlibacter sp. AN1015]|uniref:sensor histidine kinase n=1 Tax=Ramlibacter sp. AN1015 TaxID=3133428 RepID=UPI0030BE120F
MGARSALLHAWSSWRGRARRSSRGNPSVRRSIGIYVLLLGLPLLVLLPLLLYSGSLLYLFADQAREGNARELEAASHALAAVVRRELDNTMEVLELVATDAALADPGEGPGDLQRTRELMASVVASDFGIRRLALLDARGRIVAMHPEENRAGDAVGLGPHVSRAFETAKPQLSPLTTSALDPHLGITAVQPVVRGQGVPYTVVARLDPVHLAGVLSLQVGERDAVATVTDAQHRIIARSREMGRFFGLRGSEASIRALLAAEGQGVRRFETLDGNEFLWAWSSTPEGWTVMLGIPARGVDGALQQSVLRLGAAGLALLLLGIGATVLLARRLARSVDRMASNVPRVMRGQHPPYTPSGIRQLDALYLALESASAQVAQALAARDRALEAERNARRLADDDNRAKDVFIATLSHELRNPLAPVRSAAHILKLPGASDVARARAAAVVERQVATMARLLDDLLDLSRIRNGRIDLERQRVALRSVVESAIEIARPLIDARSHAFSCHLPGTDVVLDADPLRLAQVFSNLLTNAAKYTEPGGRIDVLAHVRGDRVHVHVCDSGIGLEAGELEQVFQMFTQVPGHRAHSQGGLGIGLWLVRALVELHGGWVHAESRGPAKGSEFVVELPIAPSMPQAPSDAPGSIVSPPGGGAAPAAAVSALPSGSAHGASR